MKSSQYFSVLRLSLVLALAGAGSSWSEVLQPLAVGTLGFTVSDANRSIRFFHDLLEFEVVKDREFHDIGYNRLIGLFGARVRIVDMALGEERIRLTEYRTPQGLPIPADSKSNDFWFQHIAIVVKDMDAAFAKLQKHSVEFVSTAPQTIPATNTAAAGIRAFYFRDPDDHNLELIFFPPGKGDPKWQKPTKRLFLGIDHTAIVVSDTEDSLAFYRHVLGMHVTGESYNHGTEQEYLNHVFGARLRITGLRAAAGPGIELLEYLNPRNGRPYPRGSQPNDLVHWTTEIQVKAIEPFSDMEIDIQQLPLLTGGALEIKDPDGHTIRLTEDPRKSSGQQE